jgi:hypothetical protein
MVLQMSWRGVAADVGLLSAVATPRGPGCHAANMSHVIYTGFLCGLLNFLAGSAIERATVVFAGWVAWRRACNVRKGDTSKVEVRVNCKPSLCLIQRTKGAVGMSKETRSCDGLCV